MRARNVHVMMTLTLLVVAMIDTVALPTSAGATDDYILGSDARVQEGIPKGTITPHVWDKSKVYPDTSRDYWVYVPAQYDSSKPACLMVVQDGQWYINPKDQSPIAVVFDNLIHRKEMPVTIGVFVNPGVFAEKGWDGKPKRNRSVEYDTLGDRYATLIIDEIVPTVAKEYNLSDDPERRAICGASSGGICAFTVAWERPDQFRKVVSQIGSFANIRGGHVYPGVIRKTERKPLRVFLQDGENDLDNDHGSWPLGNEQMAASLRYKGYDYKFVMGDGAHNRKHGGVVFADAMRWLWRDIR